MKNVCIFCFTKNGANLSLTISKFLEKSDFSHVIFAPKHICTNKLIHPFIYPLTSYVKDLFNMVDAFIFISACGIAVRAISPFIKDKSQDPAVIVIDDNANYVISLLSGHIGGANLLTSKISEITGALPVITTATDVNNVFSVDTFALLNNFYITDKFKIKTISSALLNGESVTICSDFPLPKSLFKGLTAYEPNKPINNCGIYIGLQAASSPSDTYLHLIPHVISIGIGCKKDTKADIIEKAILSILKTSNIPIDSVVNIASIDLKSEEQGLLDFSRKYDIPLNFYSSAQLNELKGTFSSSDFVIKTTGVDTVCERAAVLASNNGNLLVKKTIAFNGVTIALAYDEWRIYFE